MIHNQSNIHSSTAITVAHNYSPKYSSAAFGNQASLESLAIRLNKELLAAFNPLLDIVGNVVNNDFGLR